MKRSTKRLMALGVLVAFGSGAFAQKQCDLGLISVIPSTTTLHYGDTCFFDFTIINNGPASLVSPDTIYFRRYFKWGASVNVLLPSATLAPGNTQTYHKAAYIKHYYDVTVDDQVDICFKLVNGNTIVRNTFYPPLPISYLDPVAGNDSSCASTITFKKKGTTGILGLGRYREQLTVFPNPAADKINFNLNLTKAENVQVSIKDVAGREVMHKDFGKIQAGRTVLQSLDISRLQPGMYFVEMTSEGKKAVGKFTKR